MDNFEKVEKLTERAHVSFEEAKAALEASNWDMLDAMIYLERQGKTNGSGSSYSTTYEQKNDFSYEQNTTRSNAGKDGRTFGDKVRDLLKKSDENHFRITRRDGSKLIEVPIWLMIILLLAFWSICIVLFIIGLFCGCGFTFVGPDKMDTANKVMNSCEEAAGSIKDAFNGNKDNR